LPARVDQSKAHGRINESDRYPGNAGASTDIGDAHWTGREERPEEKCVQEKSPANLTARPERGQVMRAIPHNQKVCVAFEGSLLSTSCSAPKKGREPREEFFEGIVSRARSAVTRPSARQGCASRLLGRAGQRLHRRGATLHIELLGDLKHIGHRPVQDQSRRE